MYAKTYVWAKIIGYLEEQLTEVIVNSWLDDTEVIELTDDTLTLYTPSDFRQEIIREKCVPYIKDAMLHIFMTAISVEVWGDVELKEHQNKAKGRDQIFYNTQFSFESFVSGESNRIAVEVAKVTANNPGNEVYNPLFLYGPPGVGKTHLLYAIAGHIATHCPDLRIVYTHGDTFTNEMIQAIRQGDTTQFKEKYRRADVLLVDDVQFIAGKESTQEEFFHTFNDLYEHKKQIVLSADRNPSDLPTLEDRLKSRFGSGIMVGISPPDRDTRIGIIRSKAERYHLVLDEETTIFIADNVTDNARQIEGALKKVRAFHDLTGMELTLANVAKTIEDICKGESKMPVTSSLVIRNVCKYYGVSEEVLKGPAKSRGVAEPRQIAMYLIRRLVNESFVGIGKIFGRDHGTVLHSVKKIEGILKQKDNPLDGPIQDIVSNIENTVS